MSKIDAKARRSQLLSTYGIGGLFPSETSSFMIAGLDYWNEDRAPAVSEPRLARSLGVRELKMPPASPKDKKTRDVPVVRFPQTQICPACRKIGRTHDLGGDWNADKCKCQRKAGPSGAALSPFRLITACMRGHVDEFPFFQWLHNHQVTTPGDTHQMVMKSLGRTSSLEDLVLECSCGVKERSLDGASRSNAMKGVLVCKGKRPWLGPEYAEDCGETPRVLQRGASNVWFPAVRSAISIPPYSEPLAKFVNKHWTSLKDPAGVNDVLLRNIAEESRGRFTVDQIVAEAERRRGDEEGEAIGEEQLRKQEFGALLEGTDGVKDESDFVCERAGSAGDFPEPVPAVLTDLRKVTRLREVRALYGFSRLNGAADPDTMCKLSGEPKDWLPAIEVIGEGIFLAFDREALTSWACEPFPEGRRRKLQASANKQGEQFNKPPIKVDIAKVALHTFAHVLIDQLSLDAGYPASSLRERLFVDEEMAGILIYTASSDSAGSLGGVASQADPDQFASAVREGLIRLSWCSSDPVCIESTASGTDALNLAACHACVLAPETSCELNNTLLDRALLFGTHEPGEEDAGLFSEYLAQVQA
ncbi:DrmB family protein [Gordonia sp. DT218]|uniref:DrmB family protein n=1 Tax=Gordonia sp. DT218 TaxID=3416659 RepID=UPI003CF30A52